MAAPLFEFYRPEQFKINSLGAFIGAVSIIIFLMGAIAFFLLLVWGGLQWLTSSGDKAALQAARERIIQALIGLSILSLALAIIVIAQAFFGIQIFGDVFIPKGY